MGAEELFTATFFIVNISGFESLNLTNNGFMSFKKVEELNSMQRRIIKTIERKLKRVDVVLSDEACWKKKGFQMIYCKF